MILLTAREQVFYLENQTVILQAESSQPLALLAFPEAEIKSRGLQYELCSLKSEFARQESVSNALLAKEGKIEVKGGVLLLSSPAIHVSAG